MLDIAEIAYLGAALPLAGGVLGSSWGVAYSGKVAAAVLAEDPTQFRNAMILASLPMTQTFYGLIQMVYILSIYIPSTELTLARALGILGVGIVGFLAEAASATSQGIICASGIAELPRTKGANLVSSILVAILVEIIGVLGIVFTILGLSLLG